MFNAHSNNITPQVSIEQQSTHIFNPQRHLYALGWGSKVKSKPQCLGDGYKECFHFADLSVRHNLESGVEYPVVDRKHIFQKDPESEAMCKNPIFVVNDYKSFIFPDYDQGNHTFYYNLPGQDVVTNFNLLIIDNHGGSISQIGDSGGPLMACLEKPTQVNEPLEVQNCKIIGILSSSGHNFKKEWFVTLNNPYFHRIYKYSSDLTATPSLFCGMH